MSTLERHAIIQEFAEMNLLGNVVICGGESILNVDEDLAITRECIRIGIVEGLEPSRNRGYR